MPLSKRSKRAKRSRSASKVGRSKRSKVKLKAAQEEQQFLDDVRRIAKVQVSKGRPLTLDDMSISPALVGALQTRTFTRDEIAKLEEFPRGKQQGQWAWNDPKASDLLRLPQRRSFAKRVAIGLLKAALIAFVIIAAIAFIALLHKIHG